MGLVEISTALPHLVNSAQYITDLIKFSPPPNPNGQPYYGPWKDICGGSLGLIGGTVLATLAARFIISRTPKEPRV